MILTVKITLMWFEPLKFLTKWFQYWLSSSGSKFNELIHIPTAGTFGFNPPTSHIHLPWDLRSKLWAVARKCDRKLYHKSPFHFNYYFFNFVNKTTMRPTPILPTHVAHEQLLTCHFPQLNALNIWWASGLNKRPKRSQKPFWSWFYAPFVRTVIETSG